MKQTFMDETMDYQESVTPPPSVTPSVSTPAILPVGPTDFLDRTIKESFGSTGSKKGIWISILVILIIFLLLDIGTSVRSGHPMFLALP